MFRHAVPGAKRAVALLGFFFCRACPPRLTRDYLWSRQVPGSSSRDEPDRLYSLPKLSFFVQCVRGVVWVMSMFISIRVRRHRHCERRVHVPRALRWAPSTDYIGKDLRSAHGPVFGSENFTQLICVKIDGVLDRAFDAWAFGATPVHCSKPDQLTCHLHEGTLAPDVHLLSLY